ncbi:hypothetical protein [Spiroplasma poulsonii]|uniref:hypothetical protein n=1 Tax=Spiroplasma poulsonii TaxID=2138 RepID=UPI001F4C9A3A|nr:hypothetical protein [Spiroplasma poulsonii]UNF61738.1 hypothetical protein MNU24_07455 [Spiroplasma poulsonii]
MMLKLPIQQKETKQSYSTGKRKTLIKTWSVYQTKPKIIATEFSLGKTFMLY